MQSLAEIETKKAELIASIESDLKRGGHFVEDAVAIDFSAIARIRAEVTAQGKDRDEIALAIQTEVIRDKIVPSMVAIMATILGRIDPSHRLATITNSTALWTDQKTIDQVMASQRDAVALRQIVLKTPAIDPKSKYLNQTLGQFVRPFLPKLPV